MGVADVFTIKPNLPKGLNFNTKTGEISGTPTELFNYNWFNITAGNSNYLVNGIMEIAYTYLYVSVEGINIYY